MRRLIANDDSGNVRREMVVPSDSPVTARSKSLRAVTDPWIVTSTTALGSAVSAGSSRWSFITSVPCVGIQGGCEISVTPGGAAGVAVFGMVVVVVGDDDVFGVREGVVVLVLVDVGAVVDVGAGRVVVVVGTDDVVGAGGGVVVVAAVAGATPKATRPPRARRRVPRRREPFRTGCRHS